jgi:hypothetical protein
MTTRKHAEPDGRVSDDEVAVQRQALGDLESRLSVHDVNPPGSGECDHSENNEENPDERNQISFPFCRLGDRHWARRTLRNEYRQRLLAAQGSRKYET